MTDAPCPAPSFVSADKLVTFTFQLGEDPQSPQGGLLVVVHVTLFWETASPPDPIIAELRPGRDTELDHLSDDGATFAGTLRLRGMSDGSLAVIGDVTYGERGEHHLIGTLAILSCPGSSDGPGSGSGSGPGAAGTAR